MVSLPTSFVLAFLVAGPSADARPPEGPASTPAHEVVLGKVATKDAARRLMVRAGWLLGLPIAPDVMATPPAHRRQWGRVLAVRRGPRGAIVVSSFLGDEEPAAQALAMARRHFPRATIVGVKHSRHLDDDEPLDNPFLSHGMLVVARAPKYDVALREAKRFSKASGIPYDAQGMVFDPRRGLILPDDDPDDVWAGQYVSRRYDAREVTIERSDGYPGFKPGLYIAVAGIVERGPEADERLLEARRFAPGAYLKPTLIYMGCMH